MVPVVVLAVIAVILIRTLMSVVARDEGAILPPWSPDYTATPDPTTELRATVNDDVRAFLLPAVPEPAEAEHIEADSAAVDQIGLNAPTRSPR